jgi:hypothetical protein
MDNILRVTVQLAVPIKHGDDELREIELIEPTFEALQRLDRAQGDVERAIMLICACSLLPPSVIKQLRSRDLRRLSEAAATFMGEESPETGGNSGLGSPTIFTGRRVN